MAKEIAVVSKKELTAYVNQACTKFGIAPQGLAPAEIEAFGIICDTMNLSPLKREVYAIPYTDHKKGITTLQIVVGYEVYLKRAIRSGKLKGYKVRTEGTLKTEQITKWNKLVDVKRGDFKAIITINVAGWDHPFEWEVEWNEYTQDNSMWNSKPATMLKKVAMAQGFRLAFPDEIDGLPYTSDEMPDRQPVTEMAAQATEEKPKPKAKTKKVDAKAKPIKAEVTPEVEIPEYEEETVQAQAEPKPEDAPIPEEVPVEAPAEAEVQDEIQKALIQKISTATTEAELATLCKDFSQENEVKINGTPELKAIYTAAKYFIVNTDETECCLGGIMYEREIGSLALTLSPM